MIHVSIPAELEPFVQGVLQQGKYHDTEEVVGEALRLLARREQLLNDVKAGVAQLDRGECVGYDGASCDEFLADIQAEEQALFPKADGL
jgi:putative addiction module CopG family antidote